MKKLTVTVIVAALAVTNGLTFELVAQEESAAAKTSEATDNKLGEGSKDSGDEKSAELAKRSGDAADEAVADAKEKATRRDDNAQRGQGSHERPEAP